MTTSAAKKTEQKPAAAATTAQAPASTAKVPALAAFYVVPAPAGQPSPMVPIGAAHAHDDGKGFTLQLDLIPARGGQIILRTVEAKKATETSAT